MFTSFDQLPVALTVPDVANILHISKSNVYNLVRCNRLHCVRIGRKIRVPKEALSDFLLAG